MLRSPSLLLLAFFSCAELPAQVYPFVNYTPRDGLVGNKIRFIDQDSKGKLYFGATNGLSVYDGARFTNYSTENGLAHSMVNGIVEQSDDSILLILNTRAIQYLHNGKIGNIPVADTFFPVINQFIKCGNGNEYALADEGLYRFEKNHFLNIGLKAQNLSHATELDSFLLINMERNPVYRSSPRLFIAYNYYTGTSVANANVPEVYTSIKTPQNELLLATAKGVFSLDKPALKKGVIRLIPPSLFYNIPANTIAYCLYIDRQQNLWLATAAGILKISPGGSTILFTEQHGLPHNTASCIFEDREGIMWFGSDLTGITKLVDQSLQFYKEYRPGFFANEVYTAGGSDSVWLYDQQRRKLLLLYNSTTREYTATGNELLHWVKIGKQKSYAGNGTTIYELHLTNNGKFTLSAILHNPSTAETFSNLLMDNKENPIVVGTSITAILPGHKIITKPLGYYSDRAVLTKDQLLFVATRSMDIYVYKINPSAPDNYMQLIMHSGPPADNANNIEPRSIEADDSGRVWIGTRQRGLFCYTFTNNQLQRVRQLTTKDGLTENFIKYVYCDPSGHIWAGSPTGLDKIIFHDKGVSIENITKASNMYPDIYKVEADKHGITWAVTTSGLLKVYPSAQTPVPANPKIILTKFTVGDEELLLHGEAITLKHYQNSLSFQVAVPSFFDEKKTFFSYRLEKQGSKSGAWTEPALRPDINFIDLSPGNYHLKVKAIFSNGKYAPIENSYSFTILSPWWKTGWFKGLASVTILLTIIILFRLYYRYKLQQQRVALEKKQAIEKERTRIATDMHDDMGAGLSRIKVLSETIKFESQKGNVNPVHLQKISVYSEEMMDKMGEIVWALNERNDSINDLLAYTRSYAVDYLTNHNIHCSFSGPVETDESFISGEMRRNIFLSVKEVLHNVVKHADATHVDIIVTTAKGLSIIIHDNGRGIDHQAKRKFGNGLNNIRKRMGEIGGLAEFKDDNGTRVTLKLS